LGVGRPFDTSSARDVERLGRMADDHGEAIGRYAAVILESFPLTPV